MGLIVLLGVNLLDLNFLIDFNGVVYDLFVCVLVLGIILNLVLIVSGMAILVSCFFDLN